MIGTAASLTAVYIVPCCAALSIFTQIARTAHEHNMSSVLYQPGQGYTKVLSGGQHSDKPQQPGRD
jgi:hypothetical protein